MTRKAGNCVGQATLRSPDIPLLACCTAAKRDDYPLSMQQKSICVFLFPSSVKWRVCEQFPWASKRVFLLYAVVFGLLAGECECGVSHGNLAQSARNERCVLSRSLPLLLSMLGFVAYTSNECRLFIL